MAALQLRTGKVGADLHHRAQTRVSTARQLSPAGRRAGRRAGTWLSPHLHVLYLYRPAAEGD